MTAPGRPAAHAPDGAAAPADAGLLPQWDLSDLYDGRDSPRLEADLREVDEAARRFAAAHAGRLAAMPGAELAAAIAEYERMDEVLGRVMSYAQLLFSGDGTDAALGQFYQTMSERVTAISAHLLFFTLELNRVEDAVLEEKLRDPALAHWGPFLRDLRVFRPHQLSDEVEKLLHEKEVTGRAAWSRLFDETTAGMRIELDGENRTLSDVLNRLSDRDRARREAAGHAIGTAFQDRIKLFGLITNTLAKDKEILDTWRRYPRPGSARNRANMVEDEVVDALVTAVTADYGRLSHRYYAMKAKWLGLEKLQHWDRNAPLPEDDDRAIGWDEARARVLGAYEGFDPELGRIGRQFFDKPWIDARLRPGKSGGAFAHPTVPSAHPYILMNFHGRTRDVMTLAHELGHGVHQVMAARQGYFMSGTPLTLAETASVFGEMLTFRALLDAETDPGGGASCWPPRWRTCSTRWCARPRSTASRPGCTTRAAAASCCPRTSARIWLDVQTESLGPAFEFAPEYSVFWAYVPHFVHSPFYVYAYAFGDCLVNALYATFRDGHPGFQRKYLDMLRAGGTLRHKELLAPFGLDASDPAFWRRGLDVVSGFIDELERA